MTPPKDARTHRRIPTLAQAFAEPSLRALVSRASRQLRAPETVIALLGLGSLTLGGCMPPVRANFEDARLSAAAYSGDREPDASAPNQSAPEPAASSAAPCEVIAPPAGE